MKNVFREILDALLLIAILLSIGVLILYLRLPPEDRPPLSDLIPGGTRTPAITGSVTATGSIFSIPFAAHTPTSTVIPSPTWTSAPTTTPSPSHVTSPASTQSASTQQSADAEIKDGIERGNQIVEAIETYTEDKGFYPSALQDLVPDYLAGMPLTATDQPFFYRVFERTTVMAPEIYWVSFKVVSQSNVTCTYYRRIEHWDCNFSSP